MCMNITTILLLVIILFFAIRLIFPRKHKVIRSKRYKTTKEVLLAILTNVEEYPTWRSGITHLKFEENSNNVDSKNSKKVIYTEFNAKKKTSTFIVQSEQKAGEPLVKIIEEKQTSGRQFTLFSGSWSISVEPVENEEGFVMLKIIEQGVINKPILQAITGLGLRFSVPMDQFMNDLSKAVEKYFIGPKDQESNQDVQKEQQNDNDDYNQEYLNDNKKEQNDNMQEENASKQEPKNNKEYIGNNLQEQEQARAENLKTVQSEHHKDIQQKDSDKEPEDHEQENNKQEHNEHKHYGQEHYEQGNLGQDKQNNDDNEQEQYSISSDHEMGPDESMMEFKPFNDKDWDIINDVIEE